ncbi:MAG: hypothetical protein U9O96_02820 [Candidatus Thermoplasmatota archaeon]|nr:hypothetical protein [Candidatus Thermoplasmatota archaeon]
MDNRGATFIPMRVVVSIIVGAAIVALAFIGLQNAMKISAEKQVERECDKLIISISTMVASGDARDVNNPQDTISHTRGITFNFPNKLVYFGLGIDPDPHNNGNLESGLTDNGSCIFYKIKGMSKKVIWLDDNIKFREGMEEGGRWVINGPEQGFVIKGGGKYKLTLELVEDVYKIKYVLVLADDGMDV